MSTDSADVSISRVVHLGAVALLLGGAVNALAGLQIVLFFEVWGSGRFVPWAQLALGVVMVGAASPASLAGLRATLVGLGAAVIGAFLGGAWLMYALANGLVSPLLAAAPGLSLVTAAALLIALPAAQRYEAARRELMKDAEGYLGEPSRESPWPAAIGLLVALGLASPLVVTALAPEVADRVSLQASALSVGVLPRASSVFVASADDFAYPWSPFLHYLEVESSHAPFDTALAQRWVDDLALEVGLRMVTHTGLADVGAAEIALWEAGEGELVARWVAQGLRARGAFYHQETLMRHSFDPERHRPGAEQHLDCDQLVYVFTHVGWRLDLDMRPVPGVSHVYLHYRAPAGSTGETLVVETTEFRTIEVEEDRVNYAGEALGDDFFVPADWHRSGKGGTWASADLAAAAHLYEPAEADDVHDLIVGEVAVGLLREDRDVRSMLEAELEGTHDYTLVSNLHGLYVSAARAAAEAGDVELALAEGRRAAGVRAAHPNLVSLRDLVEVVPMAEALLQAERAPEGQQLLREALRGYRDTLGVRDPWQPATRTHRRLLELAEAAGLRSGSEL